MNRNIRLNIRSDFVIQCFEETITYLSLSNFKFAELSYDPSISDYDCKNEKFYPLKLYSADNITIMIANVKCGNHDFSTDAIIEILHLAGFTLKPETVDLIYNSDHVNITIWNESIVKQY